MPKVGIETPQTAHLRGFVVVHVGLALSFLPIGIIAYVEIIRNMRNNDFLSYENSNLNSALVAGNGMSVLEVALQSTVPFRTITTSDTTTDLPSAQYRYSFGYVLNRNNATRFIQLFSHYTGEIQTNTYRDGVWVGWSKLVTNSDLAATKMSIYRPIKTIS